jgi:hypothetical protein
MGMGKILSFFAKGSQWLGVNVLGIAVAFGFASDNHGFAEPSNRKISDYNSFTEICLDRENLPKATKESIESLLWEPVYPYDGVNKPSCDEAGQRMAFIRSINGISDLDLLRFTPNVESLGIDGDKVVSDFSSLQSLEKLERLVLSISSLDNLGNIKLKHLRMLYLTITGDRLASDVNAFKMMPKFTEFSASNDTGYSPYSPTGATIGIIGYQTPSGYVEATPSVTLVLNGVRLTDISALKSAKGVIVLHILGQQISDISSLSSLTHLKVLSISAKKVSNLSSLSTLTNLRSLRISDASVSDISPLSSLVNLSFLILAKNRISDISPLSSLVKLYNLDLHCNDIEDVEPLKSLSRLRLLVLSFNQITKIDSLLSFSRFTGIHISGNRVKKVDLPSNFDNEPVHPFVQRSDMCK